ncbi:thiol protease [Acanthamoeba polyphaga mimivirus]|uniref:Thiol protease n=6 Tax=Megamimivirinae TaxID=3044648 RepID=A0A2L2DMN7_MIMIV|nr:putative thiol protease [Megavirus chiliensis]AEX61709.1 putative thiolprotease [Megavirus courdo7]AFX92610.1 putative thiol protease [Megavirus courdo11]AGD92474.1 putative thiol protease [Megavirus lba]AUV58493.1 thiol protease [Bandra megavirus]AVG46276.1 thiol protease [Acanthamoeba polyphaga mimivirus]AVL93872.1 putative thiolprotease [Megavirus vitis]
MSICAPNRKYDSGNKTCFTLEQLVEMAGAYNRHITKEKLKPNMNNLYTNAILIPIKQDKTFLLKELKKRFETVCKNDDICLTQQAFMNEIVDEMRDEISEYTFRTNGPNNSKEWLSTKNIDEIMKQYEKKYPNFKFLGAVPLNCDEISFCSLFNIDFNQYFEQGINYLGIIFNHDRLGEPGSHWVSMFIDINNGKLYFCDSAGKPPIGNIHTIIKKFTDFYKRKTGKNIIYKYNNRSYQKDNSECGVYSCNFIIRKLSGESFENIINNPLTFPEINSCRNVYFRNKSSKYNIHDKCDPSN